MKKNKLHILFFTSIVLLLSSCADKEIVVKVTKATSNYPIENVSWYKAPPRLDLVFEAKNNSSKEVSLPMSASVMESFNCSAASINFYQITGQNFIQLKPGESKSFALKSKSDELLQVINDCDIDYPGEFFEKLLTDIRLIFIRSSRKSNNIVATKDINFKYEAPSTPIEE